jgi:hypothetical protein
MSERQSRNTMSGGGGERQARNTLGGEQTMTFGGTGFVDLDLDNPQSIKVTDPETISKLHNELLTGAYVFVKSGIVFELNNPSLHQACDRLAKIANFVFAYLDGASIHFLSDGVYINRTLLKVQGSRFEQGEYLTQVFKAFNVGSISLQGPTGRDDWLDFMRMFHKVVRGETKNSDLTQLRLPNILLQPPEDTGDSDKELNVTDRFRTLRGYSVAVITMRHVIHQLQSHGRLRLVSLKRALLELITVSQDCPDILAAVANLKRHKTDLPHHLINTACFTIIMAKDLGVNRRNALELVVQAALHDVGRALLPEPPKEHDVAEEERRRAQETIGQVARTDWNLAVFDRMSMRVAVANEVRFWVEKDHWVNEDYPFEVTSPARLVAVAHAYDLLTTPTKHRPALLPDEALQLIWGEAGRRYDVAAARVLINVLGVYPIGSVVQLSNGQTAIVVEAPRSGDPTKPRVKVIKDAKGNLIDGAMIDLAKSQTRIGKCVDAEETHTNIPAFLLG